MLKQLKCVTISVLDPDVIEQTSVVHVTQSSSSFDDRKNTVFDQRMGVIHYGEKCGTCHCNLNDCSGHFGHIVLKQPFFQPFFLGHIYKIMQKTCWKIVRKLSLS